MTNHQDEIHRFLDTLQSAIILAGGIKIDQDKLLDMPLADLISVIYPNGLQLVVKFEGKIRA